MRTVNACSRKFWDEICRKVKNASVFLDNNCAENLHWNGGLARLLKSGAVDIKEFSADKHTDGSLKGVFVLSSPFYGLTKDTLRSIISAGQFQYVVIASCVSLTTHNFVISGSLEGDTGEITERIENEILEWMGNMNYTVDILHIPLVAAEICSNFFIMPGYSPVFPLLSSDLNKLVEFNKAKNDRVKMEKLADVSSHNLPRSLRVLHKCFVSSLNDILEEMEIKEEIFSLGHTSSIIAQELENFPPAQSRRKIAVNPASIVFIDRTIDIATALSHSSANALGDIILSIPRLPGHKNDIAVDISSLSKAHNSFKSLSPGCVSDITNTSIRLSLVTETAKDCLKNLELELIRAVEKDKSLRKKSEDSHAETYDCHSVVQYFSRANPGAQDKHLSSLLAALGLSQSLDNVHVRSVVDMEDSVKELVTKSKLSSLSDLKEVLHKYLQECDKRSLSFDVIFIILVQFYSLLNENQHFSADDEDQLKDFLTNEILSRISDLPDLSKSIVGAVAESYDEILDTVNDIWVKLRCLSTTQTDLQQFHCGNLSSSLSSTHTPLLPFYVQSIFSPAKPDLTDIKCHSSVFKDFLKSGFGLFKAVSKTRPDNFPVCVLFVLGGITASEVKMIFDIHRSSRSSTQLIVGSTQLLKPADTVSNLLHRDRLNHMFTDDV